MFRRSGIAFIILLTCVVTQAVAPQALAAKRVALVIGIADYQHLSKLNNPVRDVSAITSLLKRHGFEVNQRTDLAYAELVVALAEFESEAQGADLALIYYAGHGMHLFGTDVIAPKDMTQRCLSDTSVDGVRDALRGTVGLDKLLGAIKGAGQKVVLIDACRNQPFPSCPARGSSAGSDEIGNGGGFRALSRLEARGVLIASSSLPGSLAQDGIAGAGSPFASALVKRLEERPRAYLRDVLESVAEDVVAATGRAQEPHIQTLGGSTRVCLEVEGCGQIGPPSIETERLQAELERNRQEIERLKTQATHGERERAEIERLRVEQERLARENERLKSRPAPEPEPRPAPAPQAFLEAPRPEARPEPPPSSTGAHRDRPRSSRERCARSGSVTICGSSVRGGQFGNSYGPGNLADGSRATAWVEGAAGQGTGEWVLLEFNGIEEITAVEISNGYGKNQDIFSKNSRVRSAELVFSGGQRVDIELADHARPQVVRLSRSIPASWMQLRIQSVYPGWKYDETCISELSVR